MVVLLFRWVVGTTGWRVEAAGESAEDVEVGVEHPLEVEVLVDDARSRSRRPCGSRRVVEREVDPLGQPFDVAGVAHEDVVAVDHRDAGEVVDPAPGDHRDAGRHRLQRRGAEPLALLVALDLRRGQQVRDVRLGDRTEALDRVRDAELLGTLLERVVVDPADHGEHRVGVAGQDRRQRLDQPEPVPQRDDVADRQDHRHVGADADQLTTLLGRAGADPGGVDPHRDRDQLAEAALVARVDVVLHVGVHHHHRGLLAAQPRRDQGGVEEPEGVAVLGRRVLQPGVDRRAASGSRCVARRSRSPRSGP